MDLPNRPNLSLREVYADRDGTASVLGSFETWHGVRHRGCGTHVVSLAVEYYNAIEEMVFCRTCKVRIGEKVRELIRRCGRTGPLTHVHDNPIDIPARTFMVHGPVFYNDLGEIVILEIPEERDHEER